MAVTVSGVGPQRLYSATFGEGVGSGAVTEAGLFNAATGGVLTNRSVFGVKNKEPEDIFTINWTLAHQRG
ncbi:hypothetical protein D3C86_1945800 [compost metagenome]